MSLAEKNAPPRKISQGDRRSQLIRMSSMKSPMLTATRTPKGKAPTGTGNILSI
jgi:hypothetical protein